jgi:hypothetical protein
LHDALTAIAREPTARRLTLRGLSRDEVGELARLSAPAPVAADALWERTDGNPLFVSEMLRLRSLDRADDQRVPDTVRDVIARRLAHLSEACRRVLLLAAVMGRDFTLGALAGVAEVSEEEVLALLEPAMHDRVVTDVPGMTGRLRFAHVLIRDTLYDGLTPAGRMRLHRLTLAALERRYRDRPGPHLAELAHHALAGGAFKAGVRYARLAGDHALSLLAYEESARLFEIALQALAAAQVKAEESARCELLLSLGEARSRAGSPAAARSAFLEAAEIAQRLGLARALGRAAAGYGGRVAWVRVDDELLIGLLERAIEMLGDDEPELRARLLARLAGALRDEPTRERRDRLSAEAVRLARQAKSSAALLFALDGRVNAIVAPDTLAECLALADEQRSLASRLGDRERALQACMNQMQAQFPLGDVAGATRGLDAAAKIAKALGEPAHLWQVAGAEAMLAIAAGRLAEADELVERAFAIGQRVLPDAARTVHALQRCTLLDFGGVPDQARAALADVVATHPARPALRCALAYVDARAGHAEEAGAALADLVAAGLPFDQEWLFGMSFLAETATLLGERAAAAALYPALRPWSVLNVADQGEGIRGAVARYLGLLAPLAGHPQDAESHFEAAIEMNTRMGARPWLALARSELAALLLERGEVKRAAALRAAATAGFSELAVPERAAPARGWG